MSRVEKSNLAPIDPIEQARERREAVDKSLGEMAVALAAMSDDVIGSVKTSEPQEYPMASKWGAAALEPRARAYSFEEDGQPVSLIERAHATTMYRTKRNMGPLRAKQSRAERGPYSIDPATGKSKLRVEGTDSLKHYGRPTRHSIKKTEKQYAKTHKKQESLHHTLTHSGVDEALKQSLETAKRDNSAHLRKQALEIHEPTIVEIGTASPISIALRGLQVRAVNRRLQTVSQKINDIESITAPTEEQSNELERLRAQKPTLQSKAEARVSNWARLKNQRKPVDLSGWLSTVPPAREIDAGEAIAIEVPDVVAPELAKPLAVPEGKIKPELDLEAIFSMEDIDPYFRQFLNRENLSKLDVDTAEALHTAGAEKRKKLGIKPKDRIPEADWAPVRDPIIAKFRRDYVDEQIGKDQGLPKDIQQEFEIRLSVLFSLRRAAEGETNDSDFRAYDAVWRKSDHDEPIRVVGYAGKYTDGRDYFYVEGSDDPIPKDEIVIE